MIRLNLVKGLGPVLQIAEGWTVGLPADVSDTLWKRTDYTWPCTWFTPRCDGKEGAFKDAYSVMNNWGANHGAISYGHIGADLITMCSMLRIPVCMHNVPEEKIFRPAAWNAFGMDKEGADFRACKNYDLFTNKNYSRCKICHDRNGLPALPEGRSLFERYARQAAKCRIFSQSLSKEGLSGENFCAMMKVFQCEDRRELK